MTNDHNGHQPNKEEMSRLARRRNLDQDQSLSAEPKVDTDPPQDIAATLAAEPATRTQRRQREIRESLLPRNPEEAETREEKQSEEKRNRKKRRRLKVRLVPVWLRLIIVIGLAVVAAVAGAMLGYGLGSGNPLDVFNPHTWTHIHDLISKS